MDHTQICELLHDILLSGNGPKTITFVTFVSGTSTNSLVKFLGNTTRFSGGTSEICSQLVLYAISHTDQISFKEPKVMI